MEEFCRRKYFPSQPYAKFCGANIPSCFSVTQIPLETTRQETTASSTRPPWIRPVRKKAPSAPRSTSADSPSQHSSPESYPSSEFFAEPSKNGSSFASGHSMTPGTSSTSPPQSYPSSDQSQGTFMDTSGGMGMDIIREDPQMYMSPAEMMALFDDGVDVAHLFSPGFMGHPHQNSQQGSPLNHSDGFASPVFMKHNGLVTSP